MNQETVRAGIDKEKKRTAAIRGLDHFVAVASFPFFVNRKHHIALNHEWSLKTDWYQRRK
jgi:hypothetical protein